jgi:hypothetical protein
MDPLTLALLMSLPALFKTGTGIAQGIRAGQLGKTPRPEFEIPESATSSLDVAKRLASGRELPGQSIMEDKLRGSTAAGASEIKRVADSPVAAMGAISNLYKGEMEGMQNLDIASAQNYINNQKGLAGALDKYAGYEQQKFKYDKIDPYEAAMNASAMLKESSLQNIYGGIQGVTSNLGTGMSGQNSLGMLGKSGGASGISGGVKSTNAGDYMDFTKVGSYDVENDFLSQPGAMDKMAQLIEYITKQRNTNINPY